MCARRRPRTIRGVNTHQTGPPGGTPRHGHVVILVEDDESLRAALERMLRAFGFEAQAYASAEAALTPQDLAWADCFVVDLNLPAMSGLDLVDRLRQRGVTAPAVIITAHDEPRVRAEVQRRGIRHFLAKPFLGSTLVKLLDDIVTAGTPAPKGKRGLPI